MPRHGDEDGQEAGRRTLTDVDIEVVTVLPRIARRSGASHRALVTVVPVDHWDVGDYRPPSPPSFDDEDVDVDADHFDGDLLASSH